MKLNIFKPNKGSGKGSTQQTAVKHPLEGVVFTGIVRDVASNGQAVLEHSCGVAVFVRGAWIGERITVKITAFKKRFAVAHLLSVDEPCEQRITPACRHFMSLTQPHTPSCGGCAWQFVDYDAQLAQKQRWVRSAIERLTGQVSQAALAPIAASAEAMGYRNRAEFKSDGRILGFNAAQSDALIDIKTCGLLNAQVAEHLAALRARLPNPQWIGQKRKGKKSYTLLAVDDAMPAEAIEANVRRPFRQGNSRQNAVLQQWLHDALSPVAGCQSNKVLELFAGSGNFTRTLAALGFEQIIAAEVVPVAVDNLHSLGLPGVQAEVADLFDEAALSALCKKHDDATILVLDPPREGLMCSKPLFEHTGFERVAYISCDLATCMRDVQGFMAKGYTLVSVLPVDMFPQTPHVELCVLLERTGR